MNEALKIILSLSIAGSLLIIVLYILRLLFNARLSKQWQYYIWLVVVVRLLLPFAPQSNLIGTLFQGFNYGLELVTPFEQGPPSVLEDGIYQEDEIETERDNFRNRMPVRKASANNSAHAILVVVFQNLWLIWLVITLILIIRKITIYQAFVKYIQAGLTEVADIDLLEQFGKLVEQNKIRNVVELYTNSLISSPLLIGFFRPCIVLPSANLPPADFEYTILHELTHYKRRDMFYKWFVQIAVCVHWFNPFVYLMCREIGRACELSCDEAVISTLEPHARRAYGDTLINAIGGRYRNSIASLTLNESKERLKERLDAIMSFQKKSKISISITLILTIMICYGAAYVGAYAAPVSYDTNPKVNDGTNQDTVFSTPSAIPSRDFVKVSFTGVLITGQGPVGVELVRSQNKNVAFELLNIDDEERCETKADIVDGIMHISVSNYALNGITVNFGPDYQNVVRVLIPDAIYTKFEIQSKEMVVKMQDFNAPVQVNANLAGFWLIDDIISQGTYDIEITAGPLYIEADTILKDITACANSGPIMLRFHQIPANLSLDSSNCGPVVERPSDWPAIYKTGNGTPKISLSNTGKAVIEVKSNN